MATVAQVSPLIRIGALASRTGVSTHVLRVWEERYQLFAPTRTPGGYRLYGPEDERRVRSMLRLRAQGVAAAQAAVRVLGAGGSDGADVEDLDGLVGPLCSALCAYDEAGSSAIIEPALAGHDLETVIERLFFPCLRYLGDAWAEGRITVGQEHFSSIAIRRRMLARLTPAQGSEQVPDAPRAVLACTSHERHDIGLLALGLVLAGHGWRVAFLGADTPVTDTLDCAAELDARLVVLCGTEPHMFAAQLDSAGADLAQRPATRVLALGGAGVSAELAERHAAVHLDIDPHAAARVLVTQLA